MERRTITFSESCQGTSRGNCFEGDTLSFPKQEADVYVNAGIAFDTETGEKHERKSGPQGRVKILNAEQPGAAT